MTYQDDREILQFAVVKVLAQISKSLALLELQTGDLEWAIADSFDRYSDEGIRNLRALQGLDFMRQTLRDLSTLSGMLAQCPDLAETQTAFNKAALADLKLQATHALLQPSILSNSAGPLCGEIEIL